ncbi:hypothetical protein CDAR_429291 [Caerostris darwini]|uniref:Uncharacterized protein n=1 Tax=Caerostris darwini TaxID=1538125 RepID=A0AAV4RQX0_9ARAC|nr:hypothetical protein CDAR_429291 [Caerostris darwini]
MGHPSRTSDLAPNDFFSVLHYERSKAPSMMCDDFCRAMVRIGDTCRGSSANGPLKTPWGAFVISARAPHSPPIGSRMASKDDRQVSKSGSAAVNDSFFILFEW